MGLFDKFKKNSSNNRMRSSDKALRERRQVMQEHREKLFDHLREKHYSTKETVNSKEQKKEIITSVSNTRGILKGVYVTPQNPEVEPLEFLCPFREAEIKCQSDLIDSLGELTKFILSSLYQGETLADIISLTSMGDQIIREEINYLSEGNRNLIKPEDGSLTALGKEYGRLINSFDEIKDGIPAYLNTFVDKFEELERSSLVETQDNTYQLRQTTVFELVGKEDYSNSLDIAKKKINSDIPFFDEVLKSLHTKTILKNKVYKRVLLKDFNGGYSTKDKRYVSIAMPVDKIVYQPRYSRLDPFRHLIDSMIKIESSGNSSFLTEQARKNTQLALEEKNAGTITVAINLTTGHLSQYLSGLVQEDEIGSARVAPTNNEIKININEDIIDGIYLEEVSRERLYDIRYFSYSHLEDKL